MLCYQLLANWTGRLPTEYLAFVLRIRINNFLSSQIRTLDLSVSLVLIVSNGKCSMLPPLEVFNLLELLPHLHLEAFLERDQSCRSNTEILSKQWGWAEGCSEPGAQILPAAANATNFSFALNSLGWGRYRRVGSAVCSGWCMWYSTYCRSHCCFSSEGSMICEPKVILVSCLLYL